MGSAMTVYVVQLRTSSLTFLSPMGFRIELGLNHLLASRDLIAFS